MFDARILTQVPVHLALASLLVAPACKSKESQDDARSDAPEAAAEDSSEKVESTAIEDEAEPKTDAERLMAWLDPQAVTVVWAQLPEQLDAEALSVVFALPPKVERVLADVTDVEEALDAILPPEAERPSEWLGRAALGMTPKVATGAYVVRPLTKPAQEVQALLASADLRETQAEGFTVMVPDGGPFPWKIAFLTEHVVGFIPAKEIGSGLDPLTAGRDFPPSEVEQELTKNLAEAPDTILELYAAGPLLHLDLGQDVNQMIMQIRPMQSPAKGWDAQLQLLPADDATRAASTLESREAPLENDQIQALVERVAFVVDGPAVAGRLQLTENDLDLLQEDS